jgi:hypothetical protein
MVQLALPGQFDKNRRGDENLSLQNETDVRQAMPEAIAPGDSPARVESDFPGDRGRI